MILRPLYCDQLTLDIASLKQANPKRDVLLLAEVYKEATYVKHHKKKLIFQFSAMRHFAQELKSLGYRVIYIELTDPENSGTFKSEIERIAKRLSPEKIVLTKPGEYRQLQDMLNLQETIDIPVELIEDNRFFITPNEFKDWASGHKQLLMENFYRMMRKKTGLLMENDQPIQGVWNLDKQNRKPLPKDLPNDKHLKIKPDTITQNVIDIIDDNFSDHFGQSKEFSYAVTREGAEKVFEQFLDHHLKFFGDYQDAMKEDNPFIFHSVISLYLNAGLLNPLDVCKKVERAFLDQKVPLNAAEGFIRQIIGWREFIRGIYWTYMPSYVENNAFSFNRKLPDFYWSSDTKMNCIRRVVKMTEIEAYSHHIQRLMVTGNFALLAGINPQEVHEWYLAVYADAYEWVELPNTIGMALHADGGIVGTKPYISSGAYIHRMSDFCKNCYYKVKEKFGEKACPFNSLYWNFLITHESKLKKNPRMKLPYLNLERMEKSEKERIQKQAKDFLKNIENK